MVVEVEVKSDLGSGAYPPSIVLHVLAVSSIFLRRMDFGNEDAKIY